MIKGLYFAIAFSVCCSGICSSWQQFQGNSSHTGRSTGTIDRSALYSKWVFSPAATAITNPELLLRSLQVQTQPCLSADSSQVFCVGIIPDSTDKLQLLALESKTGRLKWVKDVFGATGLSSFSSPVYDQGYVYWLGSNTSSETYIYKLKAETGSSREADGGWIAKLANTTVVNASPLIVGNQLFFSSYATYGSSNSTHYALAIADGSVLWQNSTAGGRGLGTMTYNPDNGYIYQSTNINGQPNISAFNPADGSVMISSEATENGLFQTALAYENNKLYVSDYDFYNPAFVYVIDAQTGKILFKSATPGSGDSCPAIAANGHYYACGDWQHAGQTRGYDANGNILWTFDQAGGWTRSPAIRDNVLFIGSQNSNSLFLLDLNSASGYETIAELAGSGPVAFGDNSFYSIGYDGKLYGYTTSSTQTVNLTLTASPTDAGTVSSTATSSTLPRYQPVTIKATPALGYHFSSWQLDKTLGRLSDSTATETEVILFDNAVVQAVFEPITDITLTISTASGSGTIEPASNLTIAPGEPVTIHAIPAEGYYFSHWTTDDALTLDKPYAAKQTLTLYQTTTLAANFATEPARIPGSGIKPKFKLTVQSSKPEKGKLKISNFPLPQNLDYNSPQLILLLNGETLGVCTFLREKKGIYRFVNSAKTNPGSTVTIDLNSKNQTWQANASGFQEEIAAICATNNIDVILQPASQTIGQHLAVSSMTKWQYKGSSAGDNALTIDKASGKIKLSASSTGSTQSISITKAYLQLPEAYSFNSSEDTITLTLNYLSFTFSATDPAFKIKKNGAILYNDKQTKTRFQFCPKSGKWSFKYINQTDKAPLLSDSQSIKIQLTVGQASGSTTVMPVFNSQLIK